MTLEELKNKIAEEVGFIHIPRGSCDSGDRAYGANDDNIIALCHKFMSEVVDPKDSIPCSCCGQERPYPQQPGRWRYKTQYSDVWTCVTVEKACDDLDELQMTVDGDDEPAWWPNNVQWEKIT